MDNQPIRFLAMGDMPYSKSETQHLRTQIKTAIAAANAPFMVHYGDFKAGNESCSDARFEQAKAEMNSLHPQVRYTPGDNDWTDCDRPGLVEPKSELERLDKLRSLFFSQDDSASVTRQADYPENARWWHQQILFTTLHIVGTNNGRTQILKDDPQTAIAQVDARDRANQAWLGEAFAEATEKNARSLVIVMQADISKKQGEPCNPQQGSGCDAYSRMREQLIAAAAKFTTADHVKKPILLIHGDTFPFCWDRTFGGENAPNLWRLNAWGDFQQPADVTWVTVQPNHSDPFQAQTLVHQRIPTPCNTQ